MVCYALSSTCRILDWLHIFDVFEAKMKFNLVDLARDRHSRGSFFEFGQFERDLVRLEHQTLIVRAEGLGEFESVALGADRGQRTRFHMVTAPDIRTERGFAAVVDRARRQGRSVATSFFPSGTKG